jgi:hypothetical protein
MVRGRIVRSGGADLALEIEEKGYDWLLEELGEEADAAAAQAARELSPGERAFAQQHEMEAMREAR